MLWWLQCFWSKLILHYLLGPFWYKIVVKLFWLKLGHSIVAQTLGAHCSNSYLCKAAWSLFNDQMAAKPLLREGLKVGLKGWDWWVRSIHTRCLVCKPPFGRSANGREARFSELYIIKLESNYFRLDCPSVKSVSLSTDNSDAKMLKCSTLA